MPTVEEGLKQAISKAKADVSGLATFHWVYDDGTVERCTNNACSAGLSKYGWVGGKRTIKYVVSSRCCRNHAKEAAKYGIQYMDWLIHRSPYKHFTLANDPSVAWNEGYIVYDAELVDANLLVSATVAHRMAWEFGGQIVYTWAKLIEYGMEETAAFLPAHMMNIGERCNGLKIGSCGYGYGAHQCIDPRTFNEAHIANWNNHTPEEKWLEDEPYSVHQRYNRICGLWNTIDAKYGVNPTDWFTAVHRHLDKALAATVKRDRVPKRKVNPFKSVEEDGGDEHTVNLDDFLPNVIEFLKEKFHVKSVH
jgi:hypothetical protein